MTRRVRAAAFAGAAAVCAALAAGATGSEPAGSAQFGPLRPVVVAAAPLPARREVHPGSLELRRVPESFVPPDSLPSPAQAVGRSPVAPIPAGGYVLGSQLAGEQPGPRRRPGLRAGLVPVEIAVQATGPLTGRRIERVDVIVTSEPGPGGSGRTRVAARGVALIDLRPAPVDSAGAVTAPSATSSVVTLAVTRAQALRLIQAESFARTIRLIPT